MKNAVLKSIAITVLLLITLAQLVGCQASNEQIGAPEAEASQDKSYEASQTVPQYYDIKLSKLEPIKQRLAVPPASFGDNIMITFSRQLGTTGFNTAVYNCTTGKTTFLDFYAGLEFKMDQENFYYLSNRYAGEGLTLVKRKNQETLAEEVIHTVPDGYQLAPRLSFGDDYLVWAQYNPTDERTQGFSLWAYDIKKQQVFEISSKCYGRLTYSYIINNGHVAYCDEDSTAPQPYIITGYDLNKREKTREVSAQASPNTMVFDGKRIWWSMSLGDKSLFVNDGTSTTSIASGVSNFDIYEDEYIVAAISGDYQVLSLSKNSVVYSLTEQGLLNEEEVLLSFFALDKETGRAVINSMVKQSDDNSATEYIYLIDFVK